MKNNIEAPQKTIILSHLADLRDTLQLRSLQRPDRVGGSWGEKGGVDFNVDISNNLIHL